ncbi:MAG: deoxyribodipyrimidine photo-lyase [Kiritimatiellia bacterium]
MIQSERIKELNVAPVNTHGRYVLYLMQQSQRSSCNHALEHAIREANRLGLPVLAAFGLTPDYPGANRRHYAFMLEGLAETQRALAARGIRLTVRAGAPDRTALALSKEAALAVTDRGYTRVQRAWRRAVAGQAECRAVEVESDVVVPVETAMDHEAYMAATLRPRIHKALPNFLVPLKETKPERVSLSMRLAGAELDLADPAALLRKLKVAGGAEPVGAIRGGAKAASKALEDFLRLRLHRYDERKDDPNANGASGLSPYLHFGQISALAVALAVKETGTGKSRDVFLEQLIVRRELAMNFAWYNPDYDRFAGLPNWAKATLAAESKTKRPAVYNRADFEAARTGDLFWNAAQREMMKTGRMHNYMRMYWGKKILEWSETPEEAYVTAVELNDRHELDGRDPNGYAGVAWCFGKHDRPWPKHPVFGNVRSMTASGLERKFDMQRYVKQMAAL